MKDYYTHLEILITKHNKQSTSYYKRITLYFTFITIIIAGLATIITNETFGDKEILLLKVISVLGIFFSIIWLLIIIASNRWLQYWKSKIFLFEKANKKHHKSRQSLMFMLDRLELQSFRKEPKASLEYYQDSKIKALCFRPKIHHLFLFFIIGMIIFFIGVFVIFCIKL